MSSALTGAHSVAGPVGAEADVPAGMVRPRASQAPRLTEAAREAYRAAGWTITPHGQVCTGQRVGPCATPACRQPTVVYGPTGQPLCPACRPDH